MDILTASPPVSAWRHHPMTIADLDAHPDAGRIWATIKAMQDYANAAHEEGYSMGFEEGECEGGLNARQQCRDDYEMLLEIILSEFAVSDALAERLRKMGEQL